MNRLNKPEEYDSYEIEEPSDEERASSSEDELDVLLNGTPDQKRKLIREYLTGESESSSEDEFEKEMEAELSSTIKSLEGVWAPPASGESSGTNANATTPGLPQPQMYDDIYFDSDSEEEDTPSGSTGRRRKQRSVPTNDELLYDPDQDDRDQAWVDAKRRSYSAQRRQRAFRPRGQPSDALPSSDAILNCPACMTTLCLDCQRHEKYRTQYRAMFVMNCSVNKEEVLRYKTQNERKQKNRKRRRGQQEAEPTTTTTTATTTTTTTAVVAAEASGALGPRGMDGEEAYHPVQCTECSTEVAVFDKDEVYHFFNILASHC